MTIALEKMRSTMAISSQAALHRQTIFSPLVCWNKPKSVLIICMVTKLEQTADKSHEKKTMTIAGVCLVEHASKMPCRNSNTSIDDLASLSSTVSVSFTDPRKMPLRSSLTHHSSARNAKHVSFDLDAPKVHTSRLEEVDDKVVWYSSKELSSIRERLSSACKYFIAQEKRANKWRRTLRHFAQECCVAQSERHFDEEGLFMRPQLQDIYESSDDFVGLERPLINTVFEESQLRRQSILGQLALARMRNDQLPDRTTRIIQRISRPAKLFSRELALALERSLGREGE